MRPLLLATAVEVGKVSRVVDGPGYSFELQNVMTGVQIEISLCNVAYPCPRLLRAGHAHDEQESSRPKVENPENISSNTSPECASPPS